MLHYATVIVVLAFIAFIVIIIYAMCVVAHKADEIFENNNNYYPAVSTEPSSELEKLMKKYVGDNTKKMNEVAQFEKVSFEQFSKDLKDTNKELTEAIESGEWSEDDIKDIYDNIQIPVRATKGSAGYDLSIPYGVEIEPGETLKFPTGIRCKIDEGWVMLVYVRSSVGIKRRCFLLNGTGVIDSDYYSADNEGHIFVAIKNDGHIPVTFNTGDKVVQAVFVPFGVTHDDIADGVRTGGIGSTSK